MTVNKCNKLLIFNNTGYFKKLIILPSTLRNGALVKHQDLVGIDNGRQSMGNNQSCSITAHFS